MKPKLVFPALILFIAVAWWALSLSPGKTKPRPYYVITIMQGTNVLMSREFPVDGGQLIDRGSGFRLVLERREK